MPCKRCDTSPASPVAARGAAREDEVGTSGSPFKWRAWAASLAAALWLFTCAASHAAELTVSAAASLGDAFREMGSAFEAAFPGNHVRFNFAASGALLQQIANGAPVDLFASADRDTMAQAEQRGLVSSDGAVDFARNVLVVVVPRDAAALPRSLADLQQPAFRHIALGVPASVPAGRYAKAALEKAGLWSVVAPKTVGAQSVRQALDYVARGEAEAGFVYATDAALMPEKVRVAFSVPTETAVRYPIGVVTTAAEPAAARRFVGFVVSDAGQAILARHGFAKP